MRLSDKAYYLIRQRIITLELPPMSPIDEQALMEELQLGRTPIREALQRLAAENLVSIVPRRGMFVADISLTDLQQVFELRMMLEGFCARLAAQRPSGSWQPCSDEAPDRPWPHLGRSGPSSTNPVVSAVFSAWMPVRWTPSSVHPVSCIR